MVIRREITDAAWEQIEPLLPKRSWRHLGQVGTTIGASESTRRSSTAS